METSLQKLYKFIAESGWEIKLVLRESGARRGKVWKTFAVEANTLKAENLKSSIFWILNKKLLNFL